MKKLTITLTLVLALTAGSYTTVFACGHQHAEKCLVMTVDTDNKTDETVKTDQTVGAYRTGATDVVMWKEAIQIFWIGLLTTGLTW